MIPSAWAGWSARGARSSEAPLAIAVTRLHDGGPLVRSGIHPILLSVVCVRDDDKRTFEFRAIGDWIEILGRVSAALAKGRCIRCCTLADPEAQERERSFLMTKGFREGRVAL